MIRVNGQTIEFCREGEILRAEPYGAGILRVRASAGRIEEENWTLLPAEPCGVKAERLTEGAVLKNGDLELVISENGRIRFLDPDGIAAGSAFTEGMDRRDT